jgi:hypothetical protein
MVAQASGLSADSDMHLAAAAGQLARRRYILYMWPAHTSGLSVDSDMQRDSAWQRLAVQVASSCCCWPAGQQVPQASGLSADSDICDALSCCCCCRPAGQQVPHLACTGIRSQC